MVYPSGLNLGPAISSSSEREGSAPRDWFKTIGRKMAELRKKIYDQIQKGMRTKDIAEKFEVSRRTVLNVKKLFEATGSFEKRKSTGRPRSARTEDIVNKVKAKVEAEPRSNIRAIARELKVDKMAVSKAFPPIWVKGTMDSSTQYKRILAYKVFPTLNQTYGVGNPPWAGIGNLPHWWLTGNMKQVQACLNKLMLLLAHKRLRDKVPTVELSQLTGIQSAKKLCASSMLQELNRAQKGNLTLSDVLSTSPARHSKNLRSTKSTAIPLPPCTSGGLDLRSMHPIPSENGSITPGTNLFMVVPGTKCHTYSNGGKYRATMKATLVVLSIVGLAQAMQPCQVQIRNYATCLAEAQHDRLILNVELCTSLDRIEECFPQLGACISADEIQGIKDQLLVNIIDNESIIKGDNPEECSIVANYRASGRTPPPISASCSHEDTAAFNTNIRLCANAQIKASREDGSLSDVQSGAGVCTIYNNIMECSADFLNTCFANASTRSEMKNAFSEGVSKAFNSFGINYNLDWC
eukprot:maker-scaffold55_size446313-snap-gene-2.16 protein:Tk00233 transcript:maker-scaffold55_size446313-snap-gene-2.16-mRNA-1 annotation:"hypothetical protein Y032_0089g2326"